MTVCSGQEHGEITRECGKDPGAPLRLVYSIFICGIRFFGEPAHEHAYSDTTVIVLPAGYPVAASRLPL